MTESETAVPEGGGYGHDVKNHLPGGLVFAWCNQVFPAGDGPTVGPCPQCGRVRQALLETDAGNSGTH
ncbi:hypothetical protein MZC64_06070 [Crossiella sp. S99.2]|nr:hypothetical protein [Crossiella sp. S99.2]MCK2251073.1 hypothetical protein [Crossiella sp. S99.1]